MIDPVTGLLVAGTVIKGAQAAGSAIRAGKINRQLRKLGTPQYGATPQLLSYYDRALQESLAPKGLSPEAVGAYNQEIAGQTTGNIKNAQKFGGGNISSVINAALNNADVISATKLAEIDANLKNQNRRFAFSRLGDATNKLQNIDTMNTGIKLEKIRGFGRAGSDARLTSNYALGDLGNAAISTAGFYAGGGFGEQGLPPTNTTTPTGTSFFKTRTPSFNMFNNPSVNFSQFPQIGNTTQTEQPVFGEQQNPNMLEVPQFNLPVQAPFRRSRINTGFNY